MGTLETAWDADANFRLARYTGSWEVADVGAAVERDPTAKRLPCPCIVDQRSADIRTSTEDLNRLAQDVRAWIPAIDESYVWLVSSPEQAGIMTLYLSRLDPERRHRWFTSLDDALGHVGITREVWDRTEHALEVRAEV